MRCTCNGSYADAKNLGGLIQALSVGLPGYAPTWIFFRNSLVSDLIFTAVFVVCLSFGRSGQPSPATSPLPRTV